MTKDEVEEQVKKTICSTIGCKAGKVTMEAHIVDDLGVDSIAKLEIVMALEDELDVCFPDELGEFTTATKITDYIWQQLNISRRPTF